MNRVGAVDLGACQVPIWFINGRHSWPVHAVGEALGYTDGGRHFMRVVTDLQHEGLVTRGHDWAVLRGDALAEPRRRGDVAAAARTWSVLFARGLEMALLRTRYRSRAGVVRRALLGEDSPERYLAEFRERVRRALELEPGLTRAEICVRLEIDDTRWRFHVFAAVEDLRGRGAVVEEKDGKSAARLFLATALREVS